VLEEPRIATERHGQVRDRCGPAAPALGMSLRWSTHVKLTRHLEAAVFAEAVTTVRSQVTGLSDGLEAGRHRRPGGRAASCGQHVYSDPDAQWLL